MFYICDFDLLCTFRVLRCEAINPVEFDAQHLQRLLTVWLVKKKLKCSFFILVMIQSIYNIALAIFQA